MAAATKLDVLSVGGGKPLVEGLERGRTAFHSFQMRPKGLLFPAKCYGPLIFRVTGPSSKQRFPTSAD